LILKQSFGLLSGTWGDLTDAGVTLSTRKALKSDILPLHSSSASATSSPHLLDVTDIRARRAGSLIYVDLSAQVADTLTVADSAIVEDTIIQTLKKARKEVAEVRVKFVPRTTTTTS
jgi:divalent metal cation (Fe/Co/Zn/Cd) transporter